MHNHGYTNENRNRTLQITSQVSFKNIITIQESVSFVCALCADCFWDMISFRVEDCVGGGGGGAGRMVA